MDFKLTDLFQKVSTEMDNLTAKSTTPAPEITAPSSDVGSWTAGDTIQNSFDRNIDLLDSQSHVSHMVEAFPTTQTLGEYRGTHNTTFARHSLLDGLATTVDHGDVDRNIDIAAALRDPNLLNPIGDLPGQPDRFVVPLFAKGPGDVDEVSMNDVSQGQVGDCFVLASMAAVARSHPEVIKNMIRDNGDGTYTVTFKQRVLNDPVTYWDKEITVSGDFPGGLQGPNHAKPGDDNLFHEQEIWPLVLEKAYGEFVGGGYATLDAGGKPEGPLEAIMGQPTYVNPNDPDLYPNLSGPTGPGKYINISFDDLKRAFDNGQPMTLSTFQQTGDAPLPYNLVPDHAYVIKNVDVAPDGTQYVELYNPWGPGNQPAQTIPFDALSDWSTFKRLSVSGDIPASPYVFPF